MAAEIAELVGGAGERGVGIERTGSGWDEPTQAYARGGRIGRGKMVYVRWSKRIQLSRPRRTGCCLVPCVTMQAHTTSSAEGVFPCRNWMLGLTEVEVRRGADLPKSPLERGGACCSQMVDAALLAFMQAHTSAEMKICGEPVSRSATNR